MDRSPPFFEPLSGSATAPNAPAGGCGPGNARAPAARCGDPGHDPAIGVDAPARATHWYDGLPGVDTSRRIVAVGEAIYGARQYLGRALLDATGLELHQMLDGLLPSLLMMVGVVALSTAVGAAAGAALGALLGGIGAVPGAAAGATAGLEVGTLMLEYLGLGFLLIYIGKSLAAGSRVAVAAVKMAWASPDDPPPLRELHLSTASRALAEAAALVFRGILQGVVAFLLAKGVAAAAGRVPELVANLRKSRLGAPFAAWVERNWAGLLDNLKLKDAPIQWPPNRGFSGAPTAEVLRSGARVDRYGYEGGTFVSPEGTPVPMRSLAPGTTAKPYNIYEVVQPIEVQAGPAAPWFGQPGGGVQYELPTSVSEAVANGSLRKVGP